MLAETFWRDRSRGGGHLLQDSSGLSLVRRALAVLDAVELQRQRDTEHLARGALIGNFASNSGVAAADC